MNEPTREKDTVPTKIRRLGANLQSHSSLLTFGVALIVLATYVVNEIVRERFKEDIDAVAGAESLMHAAVNEVEVKEQLKDVQLVELAVAGSKGHLQTLIPATEDFDHQSHKEELYADADLMSGIKATIYKLPPDEAVIKRFVTMSNQLESGIEEEQKNKGKYALGEDLVRLQLHRRFESADLRLKIRDLENSVWNAGEARTKQQERRMELCAIWANVLYMVVWLLGLIGHAYGIKGLGGGE